MRRDVRAAYDLLAAFLGVRPDRLRGVVARWRRALIAVMTTAALMDTLDVTTVNVALPTIPVG